MTSAIVKRSIAVGGHKTSISLEDEFWDGLREIAEERRMTMAQLVESVDRGRRNANLSSAVRVFVFMELRR